MNDHFKLNFDLPKDGFLEPIDLQDTNIGFSVYKERETKGFKSLFRVYIRNEDLFRQQPLKPIIVSAGYGKEEANGIILSSNDFKRKLNWPIDFISEGEFFYNTNNYKLYYREKEISGNELLIIADQWHTKTTKIIGGAWLRSKLFWFHTIQAGMLKIVFKIVAIFQYFATGEKIKLFHNFSKPYTYQYQTLNIKNSDLINLWGYKVKPWIAGIYSFFHLFIYTLFYNFNYKPHYLIIIFRNDFLTFMYGIVSLGIANAVLPFIFSTINLKNILKFIQDIYWKSAIKKVKI